MAALSTCQVYWPKRLSHIDGLIDTKFSCSAIHKKIAIQSIPYNFWELRPDRTLHINLSRIISMYLASRWKIRKKKEWWKCLCSCMQEGKGMQCHWCITNWQFKYSHAVAFCKCATKWTTGPQDHNNNNKNIPKEHQFTKRLFRQIF